MLKQSRLHIFNAYTKALWVVLAGITIVSEIIPTPNVRPLFFYGLYGPAKVICFLVLGFLTPLAFGLLNGLNRGIGFAALSAAIIEALQGLIGNGHRFHWYELLVKLGVILMGFAFGLDARSDREIAIGSVRIALIPDE
ncbi:MAG TPA: hypothetical protein VGG45_17190 [Terracidiphilus sp.]